MSTVTSANCAPLVVTDDRPGSQSPSAAIGCGPISLQASAQRQPRDGLSLTWMRPPAATSVAASTPSAGATFSFSASSALIDAMRIAGLMLPAVVLPPEPGADAVHRVADLGRDLRRLQPERFGGDDRDERARAGADVLRADPHDHAAVGGDLAVRLRRAAAAAAPRADRDAHAGLDRTGRRVAGRVPLVPAERRRALAQVRAPHRVRCFRRQVLDAGTRPDPSSPRRRARPS